MKQLGFALIEVILATSLLAVFATGITMSVVSGLNLNRSSQEQTIANQYAIEGMEAIRSIRNQNYASLTTQVQGVVANNGVWTATTSANVFDKYTRIIAIEEVLRDVQGNIVTSSGTLDPDIKRVTVNVNWNAGGARNLSTSLTSYLANWKITTATPTPTGAVTPTPSPTAVPFTPTPTPSTTPVPPTATPTATPAVVATPTPTPSTCAGWGGTCRTACGAGETNRTKLNCTGKNVCCSP
jgi:Tfp pilus assembly protein PilV